MTKHCAFFTITLIAIAWSVSLSQWTNEGPYGGPIIDILQLDGKIIVKSESKADYYESINSGEVWDQITFKNPVQLANHIYNYNSQLYLAASNGIFIYSEINEEWNSLGLTDINITLVYVSGTTMLASSDFQYENQGLFVSTDNGTNWEKTNYSGTEIVGIVMLNNRIIVGTNGDGLYSSTDNGQIWTPLNDGLSNSDSYVQNLIIQDELVIMNIWEGIFYLDNNLEWQPFSNNLSFVNVLKKHQSRMCASKLNNLFVSEDNGNTWNSTSQVDFTTINSIYLNENTIIVGTDAGLYKSYDFGETWESCIEGIKGAQIWSLDIENDKVVATGKGGIYFSNDNAQNWSNITDQLWSEGETFFNTAAILNNYLYTSPGTGIKISIDEGLFWDDITSLFVQITHIFKHLNDIYVVNSYTEEWYKSTDNGETWDNAGYGVDTRNYFPIIRSSGDYIFMNSREGLVRLGEEKTNISPDLSNIDYNGLAVYNSQVFTFNSENMFLSVDAGDTWAEINSFPFIPDVISITENLIIISKAGVSYYSSDNGESWIQIAELDRIIIDDIIVKDNLLYISTTGNGIITTHVNNIVSTSRSSNIVSHFVLMQNFPNPFNSLTNIKYSIPKSSHVSLKFYDVLGNVVATLINEEKPLGNYEVQFDASGLASGIYFYKIEAGEFSSTKKLILLR